jgi:hypothetical protein
VNASLLLTVVRSVRENIPDALRLLLRVRRDVFELDNDPDVMRSRTVLSVFWLPAGNRSVRSASGSLLIRIANLEPRSKFSTIEDFQFSVESVREFNQRRRWNVLFPDSHHHRAGKFVVPGLSILVEQGPQISEAKNEPTKETANDFAEKHFTESGNVAGLLIQHL